MNYCFQPAGSNVLLYPYGPGVNLINHSSKSPNVGLRWSLNQMHQEDLLALSDESFWQKVRPGSLILEFVALRDLRPGEELESLAAGSTATVDFFDGRVEIRVLVVVVVREVQPIAIAEHDRVGQFPLVAHVEPVEDLHAHVTERTDTAFETIQPALRR